MGIATPSKKHFNSIPIPIHTGNSMSEGYHHHHHQSHQGIFSFPSSSNGFDVRAADQQATGLPPSVYESTATGTLSEMFNFAGAAPPELHPQISESAAAAMQLFLTDPQPRSPTPPPHYQHHQPAPPPSTHMLLPGQGFHAISGHQPQFTWMPDAEGSGGGIVGGQGLSLSLSSTLEAAKAEEELRIGGGGMMFFGNQEVLGGGGGGASSSTSFKNFGVQQQHTQNQNVIQLQGYGLGHHLSGHIGFGSSLATPAPGMGMINVLRNSKYARLAQELLEEFCSVGRGQLKKNKLSRNNSTVTASTSGGGAGPSSASDSAKELPPLSAADRMEHQRRKVKLIAMLDEVERRYSQYCEQMQMVVNSYDLVMGFGGAIPYTGLAQKAMSRHFRCLKDAIQEQLKRSCELLGDKDVTASTGITKGETPRLKMLEQSLRQQRAFHQMGMMEQEAWRPQRGLPDRSVNILRAWLFEHFLHPYPSDADKHLLARQTGLSRNQVSNWFINARVRLWKPMVEEMYQQESKDDDDEDQDQDQEQEQEENEGKSSAQTPMNSTVTTTTTTTTAGAMAVGKRSEINAPENDPSFFAINTSSNIIRSFSAQTQPRTDVHGLGPSVSHVDAHGGFGAGGVAGPTLISFGTDAAATSAAAGDVSLTLGLRHSAAGGGNQQPEKSVFSFRDFAS